MPYFIYGADNFRSRKKLNAIKEKYIDKNLGDTNLAVLDGGTSKAEEIIRQILAMPFLATSRLVVVENLVSQGSKETHEAIGEFLPKIPKTTVVVFYENGTPDRRGGLFRKLNAPKYAEELTLLEGLKLRQWINRQFLALGVKAEPAAVEKLAEIVGADLWRMEQETIKLATYSPESVSLPSIDELVHVDLTGDTFILLDALAARDATRALNNLHGRLAAGDAPLYLLSMIVYAFRTLLIVQDLLVRNPRATGTAGIHPYVWRKSVNQIRQFSPKMLRDIYQYLRDIDYDCKTGIIEPIAALDLLVFEICFGKFREGISENLAANQRVG